MQIKIKRKIIDNSSPEKIVSLIIKDRQIKDKKNFLNPSHPEKIKFFDIFSNKEKQFKKVIQLLKDIKSKNQMIVVYTDYDADGLTGGAILWQTLNQLGFNARPYVPDRKIEGYGLSKKGIDNIKKQFNASLIITVDHGIVGDEKISYAKKLGIKTIITDHHTKKKTLPKDAFAIFHTDKLSGSGVAYFIAREIYSQIKNQNAKCKMIIQNSKLEILKKSFASDFLSLAAIGTIADLVPLTGVSRSMVKHGLASFSKVKSLGLGQVINQSGLKDKPITPYEIGYIIAPRINAFGRIGHGIDAMRLLCTTKNDKAFNLAFKANHTNNRRQNMVEQAFNEADKIVNLKNKIIFLSSNTWSEGIIGLIASRLTEKYYRPSIIVTKSDGVYKASCRSIKGFNIIEFLRRHQDLLIDVGGHSQAAGFSIKKEKLVKFKKKINTQANKIITQKMLIKKINIDIKLPLNLININLVKELNNLEPFGIGNPKPVFITQGEVVRANYLGRQKNHLKIMMQDKKNLLELIYFNIDPDFKIKTGQQINPVFSLFVDQWGGREKVKAVIKLIIN